MCSCDCVYLSGKYATDKRLMKIKSGPSELLRNELALLVMEVHSGKSII